MDRDRNVKKLGQSRENVHGVVDIAYHACENFIDDTYCSVFLNFDVAPSNLSYCSKVPNKIKSLCKRPWMSYQKLNVERTGMRSMKEYGKSINRTKSCWFWIKKSHMEQLNIIRELQKEGIITYLQSFVLVKRILYQSHAEYMYDEIEFEKLEAAYGTQEYLDTIALMFPEGHTLGDITHLDYWRRKLLYDIAIENIPADKHPLIRSQLINNTVTWTDIRMHEYFPAAQYQRYLQIERNKTIS